MFDEHPGQIAAVVLEAETSTPPAAGFLESLTTLSRARGALVILDEMITGFRWHNGGARAFHRIDPDLLAYGKALGNGFAVSALVGQARNHGAWRASPQPAARVSPLDDASAPSSRPWPRRCAVIRTYREEPVVDTLWRQGQRLADGVRRVVSAAGLDGYFDVAGRPCNLVYVARDADRRPSQAFRTLFLRETLRRGLLMPSMVVSYAHDDAIVDATIERVGEALAVYKRALEDGVERFLPGRPVQPVMRRFN